jgi:hypothetical protein
MQKSNDRPARAGELGARSYNEFDILIPIEYIPYLIQNAVSHLVPTVYALVAAVPAARTPVGRKKKHTQGAKESGREDAS